MELEELVSTLSYLNEDGVELYFHLTEKQNGESINKRGILTDSRKLTASTTHLEGTFFDDPDYYIDYELGNPQTREKEIMVFIGCYNGEDKFLIRKASNGDYVIPSENIIGYLDLNSKQFNSNPNTAFDMGLDSSIGSYL